ncbi:MAG: hypothetical protein AAF442_05965 [Pseudomonadota bacterium]
MTKIPKQAPAEIPVGLMVVITDVRQARRVLARLRAQEAAGEEGLLEQAWFISTPQAGSRLGPMWWRALLEEVGVPPARAILRCGVDTGAALAAVRSGVLAIEYTHDHPALLALAEDSGMQVWRALPADIKTC